MQGVDHADAVERDDHHEVGAHASPMIVHGRQEGRAVVEGDHLLEREIGRQDTGSLHEALVPGVDQSGDDLGRRGQLTLDVGAGALLDRRIHRDQRPHLNEGDEDEERDDDASLEGAKGHALMPSRLHRGHVTS